MYSEESIVKLIRKLDVTDLSGEKVMIDFDSGKYFLLKGVANDIWEYIDKPISIRDIKKNIMGEYEIDEDSCQTAIDDFLKQLVNYKLIQISE